MRRACCLPSSGSIPIPTGVSCINLKAGRTTTRNRYFSSVHPVPVSSCIQLSSYNENTGILWSSSQICVTSRRFARSLRGPAAQSARAASPPFHLPGCKLALNAMQYSGRKLRAGGRKERSGASLYSTHSLWVGGEGGPLGARRTRSCRSHRADGRPALSSVTRFGIIASRPRNFRHRETSRVFVFPSLAPPAPLVFVPLRGAESGFCRLPQQSLCVRKRSGLEKHLI